MVSDYQKKDLRGRSFKHQDLAGANFSNADIRGADFTRANLERANFSNVIAGVPRVWVVVLEFGSLVLAAIVGLIIGYAAIFPGLLLSIEVLPGRELLIALGFIVLVVFLTVLIRQGVGSRLGTVAFIVAAFTAILAIVINGEGEVYENILGAIVLQPLSIAFAIVGVLAGSVALGITISFRNRLWLFATGISLLLGTLLGGTVGGSDIRPDRIFVAVLIASLEVLVLLATIFYISLRALAEDRKYSLINKIVVFLCSFKGTNFYNTNLTEADFTEAKLEYTEFRKAVLKCTCWFKVENLHLAHVEGTYLEDSATRQLVTSKDGRDQMYDYKNLRGLNLQQATLAKASLIGADLSEATLKDADLSGAKIVQARLYGVDLTHANLTGAYIQDWVLSTDTKLNDVKCEFVFMRLPTQDNPEFWRKPDNSSETFNEGDFTDFIAPIMKTLDLYRQQKVDPRQIGKTIKTLDLYHHKGINPAAAAIALKNLAEENPDAGLEVVALGGRGDEKTHLQAVVTGSGDSSRLSAEYSEMYRQIASLPQEDIQTLLARISEKDDRIRSLEKILTVVKEGNNTYYIQAGRDISGVLNLGTISGDVSNAIAQHKTE